MMNLMQSSMPGVPNMPAMPNLPEMPALSAMVPAEKLAQLQKDYAEEMSTLWTGLLASRSPEIRDRRFSSPAWSSNPLYAFSAAA